MPSLVCGGVNGGELVMLTIVVMNDGYDLFCGIGVLWVTVVVA